MLTIGQKIRSIRQRLGLNQTDFALKIGITPQRVSNWERGENDPDKEILEKIKKTFKLTYDDLMPGEDNNGIENTVKEPVESYAIDVNRILRTLDQNDIVIRSMAGTIERLQDEIDKHRGI